MLYLNVLISIVIVSVYLVVKLPKLHQLSSADGRKTLDRWAVHFSYEVLNQLLAVCILLFISAELAHRLFQFQRQVSFASVLTVVGVIFFLDFLFYWRHRFYHRFLMSIHSLHHRDRSFDLTVTFRIHPLEMMVQMLIFLGTIYFFGLDRWQMVIINIVFTVQAFYSHFELDFFPDRVNHWLAVLFVVPQFHSVHHREKTPLHFGFLFCIWDRIFGTLTKEIYERDIDSNFTS